jgi:stringent starvation protein B
MLSNKPYLIRAFNEWIIDSKCTPFVVINANYPRCKVPLEHVEDGQITLNISSEAIRDLKIGNEFLEFRASFTGVIHIISAPIKAVLAIYAQENGQGMYFDSEEENTETEWAPDVIVEPTPPPVVSASSDGKKRPSHLTLVE